MKLGRFGSCGLLRCKMLGDLKWVIMFGRCEYENEKDREKNYYYLLKCIFITYPQSP